MVLYLTKIRNTRILGKVILLKYKKESVQKTWTEDLIGHKLKQH